MGCPHDYALTPHDMQRIDHAQILVVNGLGMEDFLGAAITQTHPRLLIVDSSQGIPDTLAYPKDDVSPAPDLEKPDPHEGINPHLFASPRMMAVLAVTVATGLSKVDPDGAELYTRNAGAYAGRLNRLAAEFSKLGKTLKSNRIITQHGVFDYLARDMGLQIVARVQAHAGQDPSAAEMLKIVKRAREKKASALFTEPQYPAKVGQTLAKEIGIPSAALDPVATGPEHAPLDYYETVMRANLDTLRAILGSP